MCTNTRVVLVYVPCTHATYDAENGTDVFVDPLWLFEGGLEHTVHSMHHVVENKGRYKPVRYEGSKPVFFPIIITSYDILMRDAANFRKFEWAYLVVDEGHRLKNKDCKLMRELKSLQTNQRLLLTELSTFPYEASSCVCLEELYIQGNNLSGAWPLPELFELQKLNISNNSITTLYTKE